MRLSGHQRPGQQELTCTRRGDLKGRGSERRPSGELERSTPGSSRSHFDRSVCAVSDLQHVLAGDSKNRFVNLWKEVNFLYLKLGDRRDNILIN